MLTEILLPRIAPQGTVCLVSIRGWARTTRIDKFDFGEGLQPYHPHFRVITASRACAWILRRRRDGCPKLLLCHNCSTQLGRRYSPNAACLLRPHLFCVFRRVKDQHNSLHDSSRLKNTCARQVVLDKWFPWATQTKHVRRCKANNTTTTNNNNDENNDILLYVIVYYVIH